ncbi:MAG: CHAT domain-containing tetratricopeptide repeat protein [Acidobacteriota bacterium]
MTADELAARLIAADPAEQIELLAKYQSSLNLDLAYVLKSLFYDTRIADPASARRASDALTGLATFTKNPEITALANWIAGIAALEIDGQIEPALAQLNAAEQRFLEMHKPHDAALTSISKLRALAMLGRYDEALECGAQARDVLVAQGDLLAAGKIEHNLGNIYFRRDRYHEAEKLYRAARARFAAVDDQNQLVLIDTSLAMTLINQHRFRDAEALCRQALARAEATGQVIAQAAIECDLGCLALLQGRYHQSLDLLEKSRRRYAALGLAHESAIADLELANAYLELNLAPEAEALYSKTIPVFAKLGMQAEQAHALAANARAHLLLGQFKEAATSLAEARALYVLEGNLVGEAMVNFAEAQIDFARGDFARCEARALKAELPLTRVGARERALLARWLRGEACRAQNREADAREIFNAILSDAGIQGLPQIAQRCYTSLGFLEENHHEFLNAEAAFKHAVELIEDLRALLPSDEFRTAFVSDKLIPYIKLVELCLRDENRLAEAIDYVERSRSRSLADMLSGAVQLKTKARDPFEAGMLVQLETLREELNWLYRQINRPPETDPEQHAKNIAALYETVHERETRMLEIMRHIQQRGDDRLIRVEPFDLAKLQRQLERETAIIEYFSINDELLAFIITGDAIHLARNLGSERAITSMVERLRFQINSLRYGAARMQNHLSQLAVRARHYLASLYDALLRPFIENLVAQRLVVVPHRALHYVPFHALYDGEHYVIERREICYAPSANVLSHCLNAPQRNFQKALLFGVADEQAPQVLDEAVALEPLFAEAKIFLGEAATLAALNEQAADAEVLHLACHGQFRSDNPLFSSLKLSDGYLTARDAYQLNLQCGLVTLSACETGMNAIAPGDELLGLTRGFFSAGAPTLLLTLWTVDDAATAELMKIFYGRLLAGNAPAAALRFAQCEMLKRAPHPFFWSPFVLMGRW